MKIKIVKDCEVEIAKILNKGEPDFEPTLFKTGKILDVEVIDFGMTLDGLRKDLPLFHLDDGTCGTFAAETFEIIEGGEDLDEFFNDYLLRDRISG
jgi:hypothetical protein